MKQRIAGKIEGGRGRRSLKLPLFFRKKYRFASSEAVNGLLYISHEKHVFPAHRGQKLLLHGIDVLIFVHKHVTVFSPHLFGNLR